MSNKAASLGCDVTSTVPMMMYAERGELTSPRNNKTQLKIHTTFFCCTLTPPSLGLITPASFLCFCVVCYQGILSVPSVPRPPGCGWRTTNNNLLYPALVDKGFQRSIGLGYHQSSQWTASGFNRRHSRR